MTPAFGWRGCDDCLAVRSFARSAVAGLILVPAPHAAIVAPGIITA